SGQKTVEAIVVVVNQDIITLSQYRAVYDSTYAALQAAVPSEEFQDVWLERKKMLMDTIITNSLLLQEARKLGLNVTEQLRMTIDRIKEENNLETDADLIRELQKQGMTWEQFRKQLEDDMMRQALVYSEVDRTIVIDDSDYVDYYKKHPEEFVDPAVYHIKALYLSGDNWAGEALNSKKSEIDARLAAGEVFATVAGELTEGPGKEEGGDLGTLKSGEMAKELEDAVKDLEAGQTASWLEFREGWWRLYLEEITPSQLKSFEDSRPAIEQKLMAQQRDIKLEEYMIKLKERSYIKILIPTPEDLF
ncbi:MAG: SurA N-terminal domain-containing protein, partial [Candidatus Aminicenantes bacterium]|nr:SurA N-terminal domain-containing protein [Candidatus Aminicenantes bacterium]